MKVIQLARCGADRGSVPLIMKEIVKAIQQGSETPQLWRCFWRSGSFDGVFGSHFSASSSIHTCECSRALCM